VEDKLRAIFSESLNINASDVVDELRYSEIPQWDSVAHMALIASIEEGFDIMLDAEDVINLSSFLKAKEIIAEYLR
jgi:acyl carrier protein